MTDDEKQETWEEAETGEKPPAGMGEGPAESDTPGEPEALGVGGYAGRDPESDMPRIPTVPETQDDPRGHDAAPDPDTEPPASN